MKREIHILLIDDHTLVRDGVEAILQLEPEFKRITHACNGKEALAAIYNSLPDIILLDRRMPECDGFDLLVEILKAVPHARVMMMTASASPREVELARSLGAAGHLSKNVRSSILIQALRAVLAGGTYFESQQISTCGDIPQLTPRELDVLDNLRRGLSNQDISIILGISEYTVKGHLKLIFAKLNVSNRSEAVTRALESGILDL